MFINALKEVTRERAQSFLEPQHIDRILEAHRKFDDVEGFAAVAEVDAIAANNFNLSIPLYVRGATEPEQDRAAALADALDAWETSSVDVRESMARLFETLEGAGLGR